MKRTITLFQEAVGKNEITQMETFWDGKTCYFPWHSCFFFSFLSFLNVVLRYLQLKALLNCSHQSKTTDLIIQRPRQIQKSVLFSFGIPFSTGLIFLINFAWANAMGLLSDSTQREGLCWVTKPAMNRKFTAETPQSKCYASGDQNLIIL